MSDKETRRKCFKCGKSPASDNIKLFRFPKPATRNLLRCTMWAKYLFPSEEQYCSLEFQKQLFSEHRMLCQDHFTNDDFTDSSKARLLFTAIPHDTDPPVQVPKTIPSYCDEPQPGPSQLNKEIGPIVKDPEPSILKLKRSLANVNLAASNLEEVQSGQLKLKPDREKNLLKKCTKYMRAICQIRNKYKKMKKKALLNLMESTIVQKLAKKLTPTFAFLLQAQIRNCNKSTGCRWTKEEKIVALRLFKRSPTCYRLLRRLFQLPSPSPDLRRGKRHATNMTARSPHFQLFSEMKRFFENMKFVGSPRVPPSQDGWIWTINGVEYLFRKLSRTDIKSLPTRRLQQDALENLFGCIRSNCGSNSNPTIGQFVAGLKTSIISNMAHIGTSGNCEIDNNVIINNFSMFLSVSQSNQKQDNLEIQELSVESFLSSPSTENAELQACSYVCGFLLKRIPNTNCEDCKSVLMSPDINLTHMFVQYKEYNEHKNSLNYASQNLIECVESCATNINLFLNKNAHEKDLKKRIIENVKSRVNFEFLHHCTIHRDENIYLIVNCVFHICIKRFCIVKNRLFADEASASALKRKINIMLHK